MEEGNGKGLLPMNRLGSVLATIYNCVFINTLWSAGI